MFQPARKSPRYRMSGSCCCQPFRKMMQRQKRRRRRRRRRRKTHPQRWSRRNQRQP